MTNFDLPRYLRSFTGLGEEPIGAHCEISVTDVMHAWHAWHRQLWFYSGLAVDTAGSPEPQLGHGERGSRDLTNEQAVS